MTYHSMLRSHMPHKMILPLKPLPRIIARATGTLVLPHIRVFIVSQRVADEVLLELECHLAFLANVTERKVLAVSQLMPPVVLSS